MEGFSVIGKRLSSIDGILKVTGKADFVGDMSLPRTLFGKILRSPLPHAKVLYVDKTKAERLSGVKAVMAGEDIPRRKFATTNMPGYPPDKYSLAVDKVRYIGDEVAAVAALDEDTALEALELIRVEYEPLQAVFDPMEAMEEGAPQIHEHAERNICAKLAWNFGDLERGFRESSLVREDRFKTDTVTHCPMEPHGTLASWDPSGKITVWASTQSPFTRRTHLSQALGIPESKIRVINPYVGGGFGSKSSSIACPEVQATLLSMKTQYPVKIIYTREEVFSTTLRRHPMIIDLKTGIKSDGIIWALDCKLIAEGGAYTATGPIVIQIAGDFLVITYRIPNVRYEAYRVYTNRPTCGPQRGHGAPQPRFAFDSQLDMMAEEMGLDPLEVRLKNAIQPGTVTPLGSRIKSCGLSEAIIRVAEEIKWKEERGKGKDKKGIGMGCGAFVSGVCIPPYTASSAFVKVHEDGGITLLTGVTDIGQGSSTILAQIVADTLGVHLEDLRVISGDTELTPAHAGSFSSRGTLWGGKAVREAALDVKRQLFQVVAEKLEVSPEDLEAKDRRVYVKGSPGKGMSFKEALWASFLSKEGNPLLGKGYYHAKDVEVIDYRTGMGNRTPAYSFGAQGALVIVDKETGKVNLEKMAAAHDCGFAVNPLNVEGQLEGSISMGQGQVLLEELTIEKGQVMNPNFLDYKLPTAIESIQVKTIVVESRNPEEPFEPKEAGEGTQISTPAAIANAIYDAVGVRVKEIPATPEKILEALK